MNGYTFEKYGLYLLLSYFLVFGSHEYFYNLNGGEITRFQGAQIALFVGTAIVAFTFSILVLIGAIGGIGEIFKIYPSPEARATFGTAAVNVCFMLMFYCIYQIAMIGSIAHYLENAPFHAEWATQPLAHVGLLETMARLTTAGYNIWIGTLVFVAAGFVWAAMSVQQRKKIYGWFERRTEKIRAKVLQARKKGTGAT